MVIESILGQSNKVIHILVQADFCFTDDEVRIEKCNGELCTFLYVSEHGGLTNENT